MAEIQTMVAARPLRIVNAPRPKVLKPDLAAVERMSDATGMLQHSIYSIPDRRHGLLHRRQTPVR